MKRSAADADIEQGPVSLDDVPDLYERFDDYLTKCRQKFLAEGVSFVFDIDQLATDEGLKKMEESFKASGVACVVGFDTPDSLPDARAGVAEAAFELAADRVSDEERWSWKRDLRNFDNDLRRARCPQHPRSAQEQPETCDWCRKGPVWGNCGFGYLFAQMRSLASTPKGYIEGNEVPMMQQPMYAETIAWLATHPKLADVLLRFCAEDDMPRMVSWDSAKYVNDAHKGTKKEFTKMHTDQYSGVTRRIQMCVEFSERRASDNAARQLGYVPFTSLAGAQDYLAHIQNLGRRRGFIGMHKDPRLVEILRKHAISFAGPHLACWAQGVVHFEAMFASRVANPTPGTLTHYESNTLPRGQLETLRMVCGTNNAIGSTLLRSHLAAYALNGFLPDAYHTKAYKNSVVGDMMFSGKTTQYKKERKLLESEKRAFDAVNATVQPNSVVLPKVPPLVLRLVGLPEVAKVEESKGEE